MQYQVSSFLVAASGANNIKFINLIIDSITTFLKCNPLTAVPPSLKFLIYHPVGILLISLNFWSSFNTLLFKNLIYNGLSVNCFSVIASTLVPENLFNNSIHVFVN